MDILTPCKIGTLEQIHTICRVLLRRWEERSFQILWKSVHGRLLGKRVKYNFLVTIFFLGKRRKQTSGRILTNCCSKYAESRKDVPFWVKIWQVEIWPLFIPKIIKIWPQTGNFQPQCWNMKVQVYQKVLSNRDENLTQCRMLKIFQFKTHCKGDIHSYKTANIILPGLLRKYRWTPLRVQNRIQSQMHPWILVETAHVTEFVYYFACTKAVTSKFSNPALSCSRSVLFKRIPTLHTHQSGYNDQQNPLQ